MASAVPFQSICDEETKLLPDAVSVTAGLPAEAELGLKVVKTGEGFPGCIPFVPPPPLQPKERQKKEDKKQKRFKEADRATLTPHLIGDIHYKIRFKVGLENWIQRNSKP